jgi:hypothetical protein
MPEPFMVLRDFDSEVITAFLTEWTPPTSVGRPDADFTRDFAAALTEVAEAMLARCANAVQDNPAALAAIAAIPANVEVEM